jgi:membrane associated rhomboid family serine protease
LLPLRDNVPTRHFPIVTVGLIAANFAVWSWELSTPDAIDDYAYYPCSVAGPCVGQAVDHLPWWEGTLTSMFIHASWVHILGNMLFLWIFGNNVEDSLGRVRYLFFYVASGYVATAAQTLVTINYADTADRSVPNVGASGAVAGVLGAYLFLLPSAMVLTLIGFFIVPVPANFFLGFWFLLQLWAGGFAVTHPQPGGGVAFFAHAGGFVFGYGLVRLLRLRAPPRHVL